jgi:hypothetical protein
MILSHQTKLYYKTLFHYKKLEKVNFPRVFAETFPRKLFAKVSSFHYKFFAKTKTGFRKKLLRKTESENFRPNQKYTVNIVQGSRRFSYWNLWFRVELKKLHPQLIVLNNALVTFHKFHRVVFIVAEPFFLLNPRSLSFANVGLTVHCYIYR